MEADPLVLRGFMSMGVSSWQHRIERLAFQLRQSINDSGRSQVIGISCQEVVGSLHDTLDA